MGARVKVTAVVLNWRRPDDTIACVRSVQDTAPGVEIIVVDNASRNGSIERLRSELDGVTLIENEENLGYAGGNNVGVRAAPDADAVLILNNDVTLRPRCVEQLVLAAEADPQPAIRAPLSLSAEDPGTIDFFRARVDLRNVALLAEGRGEARSTVFATDPVRTDYATGSALLVDRALLGDGPFDERFFLVWEDVDLCVRARGAIVVPAAEVLHRGGVSFGEERNASPLYQYCFVRNSFLVVRKHVGWPFRTGTLRRIETRYRGWVEQAAPDVAAAIALGIEHGLAGRYGPPPPELLPASAAG